MESDEVAPFSKCLPLEKIELDVDLQQQQSIDEPTANPEGIGWGAEVGELQTENGIEWGAEVGELQTQNQNNNNNNNNNNTNNNNISNTTNPPHTNTTEQYLSPPPQKKEFSPIRLTPSYITNKEKAMTLLLKKDVPFGKIKPSKKSSIICEVLVSEVESVKTNKDKGVKVDVGKSIFCG